MILGLIAQKKYPSKEIDFAPRLISKCPQQIWNLRVILARIIKRLISTFQTAFAAASSCLEISSSSLRRTVVAAV